MRRLLTIISAFAFLTVIVRAEVFEGELTTKSIEQRSKKFDKMMKKAGHPYKVTTFRMIISNGHTHSVIEETGQHLIDMPDENIRYVYYDRLRRGIKMKIQPDEGNSEEVYQMAKKGIAQQRAAIQKTGETRIVKGYTCNVYKGTALLSQEIWTCEELEMPEYYCSTSQYGVPGLAMKYVVQVGDFWMAAEVKEIHKRKVSAEEFAVPSDYDIKDLTTIPFTDAVAESIKLAQEAAQTGGYATHYKGNKASGQKIKEFGFDINEEWDF